MKKNILMLLLTGMLSACDSKPDSTTQHSDSAHHAATEHGHDMSTMDPQVSALMGVHDSIMLQMDSVMSLKRDLKNQIKTSDSLLSVKADNKLKTRKNQAESLLSQLNQADQAMMDWMHHYKADTLEKLDAESKTAYIQAQQQQIETVGQQISKTVADARQFVNP